MEERLTKKYIKAWDGKSFEYARFTPSEYLKEKRKNPKLQMINEDYDYTIHVTTIIPYFEHLVVKDDDFEQAEGIANFSLFPIFSFSLSTQAMEATSAMDMLLDVQDDINKGKSMERDYVQQIVSALTIVSKREPDILEELKRKKGQPGLVLGAMNVEKAVVKIGPDQIPPEVLLHPESAYQFAENITGIGKTIFGKSEKSGESGVLFEKKLQTAVAVINPYYRNVSRLRKHLLEDFIDNFGFAYADQDRLIQLKDAKGLQGQAYLNVTFRDNEGIEQIINSTKNLSLYVELDEGQDSITSRETNFENSLAVFNVIANVNPDAASALIGPLLEDAPLRNKDEWLEIIQSVLGQQSEASARSQQLQEFSEMMKNQQIRRGLITDQEKLLIEASKTNNANATA